MTLQSYYMPTEKGLNEALICVTYGFSTTVLLALIYAPFFSPSKTSDPWDEDRVSPAKPLEERNR